jgi:hypothetical protein
LSSGNQGVARGLFMETIGYRLSNPVSLTFNLGFQHQPYSSYGPSGISQGAQFVGGAALDWRPANNMFLHFEVGSYPSYGNNYYSPYGKSYYTPYWNYNPYPSVTPTAPATKDPIPPKGNP